MIRNVLSFTRRFILIVFAGALIFLGISCNEKATSKKPNILFIFPDQFRSDFIGVRGGDFVHTPHIDRIAREGALFTRSYVSAPTCLPARATLLTGMAPWKHGLLAYAPIATKYPIEMPRLLKDAGYYTFATGKLHFKPIGGPPLKIPQSELDNRKFMHGFDEIRLCEGWGHPQNAYNEWFEKNAPDLPEDGTGLGSTDHRSGAYQYADSLHPTAWTASEAIRFINSYDDGNPFFVKVAFHRPHPPFDPPQRWLDFYKGKEIPGAAVGEWSQEKYGEPVVADLSKQVNSPRGNFGDQFVRHSREGYLAAISYLDEQIGLIISALEEKGELENTLILLSSDHGDMMGDHHLWRKSYAYEGSAGVPMVIRWPESMKIEADRGQVLSELVELRDVLPTFLDAAGADIPAEIDGMSMLNLVRGKKDSWRKVLDLEHGRCYWPENSWTALTDARYKYIYFNKTGEEQLFDLEKDPMETVDLAGAEENRTLLQSWRQHMIDHLSKRGEPWVMDGQLGTWEEPINFGPNYPMEYYPEEIEGS